LKKANESINRAIDESMSEGINQSTNHPIAQLPDDLGQ
jgi:hypothetical protein